MGTETLGLHQNLTLSPGLLGRKPVSPRGAPPPKSAFGLPKSPSRYHHHLTITGGRRTRGASPGRADLGDEVQVTCSFCSLLG